MLCWLLVLCRQSTLVDFYWLLSCAVPILCGFHSFRRLDDIDVNKWMSFFNVNISNIRTINEQYLFSCLPLFRWPYFPFVFIHTYTRISIRIPFVDLLMVLFRFPKYLLSLILVVSHYWCLSYLCFSSFCSSFSSFSSFDSTGTKPTKQHWRKSQQHAYHALPKH